MICSCTPDETMATTLDICMVSVNCPCKEARKVVKFGSKMFNDVLQEVQTCKFVSASGRVDKGDKWTDISVVSGEQLVCGVMSLFQFKYISFNCIPEEPEPSTSNTSHTSAFDLLFHAQQRNHLPQPKAVQTRKDELRNDLTANLKDRGVGFSRDESP